MTAIKLRDYQREAIDAVFAAWSGGMQRPAIVLPTGAGKTVVFASLIKEFRNAGTYPDAEERRGSAPGNRVIVLAHRDELVDQAIAKIRAIAPDLNVGKVKAKELDYGRDVVVCSVQTLASVRGETHMKYMADYGPIGLIITDECHHAAAASYGKVYDAFPDALQLGVTATMSRGDGVGLGSVWEDVVYKRSILNLISKGHLTDVRTRRIDLESLSMAGVRVGMGDWQAAALGDALMESKFDTVIADAYKEHAGDRQGIVFTPTVETAEAAMQALASAGIPSAMVDGTTPREQRQQIYEKFRTGKVQVLANCMVLTEGFDAPWASCAVIARPTRNESLYVQMVGRVLRPWPDKKDALVLDLVGASANKLRTLIDLEPGAVEDLRDGESLAEAVVREAGEKNAKVPAGSLAFELKVRDVDSFGASSVAWNRSPKGVMFISCGDTRVFLWPAKGDTGLWDVCTQTDGQRWERTRYTGLSLGEAMAWGEAVSEDYAAFSVAKSARWRSAPPSEKQVALASALGIQGAADMRRGALSAAIDVVLGGAAFDHYV